MVFGGKFDSTYVSTLDGGGQKPLKIPGTLVNDRERLTKTLKIWKCLRNTRFGQNRFYFLLL